MITRVRCALTTVWVAAMLGPFSATAQLSIALNPKAQYAGNSCRSYGIALAIGSLPASPFPIGTARELRAAEKDLQTRFSAKGSQLNLPATDHKVWKAAVEEMSSGKLELVLEYPRTDEEFYARVRALTGVADADVLGAAFSAALVKTAVMTSVKKIGATSYPSGHIVTVFGVSRREVSPTPLAILNPAIKVADKNRIACEIDDVPNDDKWSALASIESSYELNDAFNGFLVMWVRKK